MTGLKWVKPIKRVFTSFTAHLMASSHQAKNDYEELLAVLADDLKDLNRDKLVREISRFPVMDSNNDIYTGIYKKKDVADDETQYIDVKVAIKSLRQSMWKDRKYVKSFVKEAKIWSMLSHTNIMTLEGYVTINEHPCLMSEWEESGTINDYIKNNTGWSSLELIAGIASGIKYLHDEGVIHSDLKGPNILVGKNGVPKITDFGSSRMRSYSHQILMTSEERIKGSAYWLAYEIVEEQESGETTQFTKASDMWAFGMVVLEILTKSHPYSHLHGKPIWIVIKAIYNKELPKKPLLQNQIDNILWEDLCLKSWNFKPKHRLTADEAHNYLQNLRQNPERRKEISPQAPIRFPTNFGPRPTIQVVTISIWSYLRTHSTLEQIHNRDLGRIRHEDIIKTFPGILEDAYSLVQRATLKKHDGSKTIVTLKTLKRFRIGDKAEGHQSKWVKELGHLAKLSHENIVEIEGFYLDDKRYPVIVSAWAGGGAMPDYIKNHHDCNLQNIAAGIARGLRYIHKKGIIHVDLKGANILMTEGGIPMLSDFSQVSAIRHPNTIFADMIQTQVYKTFNWVAPEIADYMNGDNNPDEIVYMYTKESDMWSYGMVIYELITGSVPYANNLNMPKLIYHARLQVKIARGQLPDKPGNFDETREWLWKELCVPCWKMIPAERLSAEGAVAKFTSSAFPVNPLPRLSSMGSSWVFWTHVRRCFYSVLVMLDGWKPGCLPSENDVDTNSHM